MSGSENNKPLNWVMARPRKGCLTLFIVRLVLTMKSLKSGFHSAKITRADFGSDYLKVCLHALKVTIIVLMHISAEICLLCVALELLMTPGCN